MTGRILLVRHTAVAMRWRGVCYGVTDVGLSREGRRHAGCLADELARQPITAVVHSGLKRAAILATLIARRHGLTPLTDRRWRERDFGNWEGRRWNAIWRETGDEMDRMMRDPDTYRPGGGETGRDLAARVAAAFSDLPSCGTIVIVSHGGPIASLRTLAAARRLIEAANFIPAPGAIVELSQDHPITAAGQHSIIPY